MTTLFPVIMCGGAGTRLWPASRPSRPKQFIPLAGNRSLFQETVTRVHPLTSGGGQLVVVAGLDHREAVTAQLQELGVHAQILLEPEARDSAAAMAAAAAWTARQDPLAVNLFLASDHFIPDHEAFRSAVHVATAEAAKGRVVTLGVVPSKPSSAYGYIAPAGPGLADIIAFVEKPDIATAAQYIADGYLWNSGNFIVQANVLLDEMTSKAPSVKSAAMAAVTDGALAGAVLELSNHFLEAPKISIDYAVMEHTSLASVLAVDFEWSDLGAWDSVHATGEGAVGAHLLEDAEGCLVRACDGVMVAAIGVRDLAIVVERDAVLVADLGRSQDVKKIVERLKTVSPQHLDFKAEPPETLAEGARRFANWMRLAALPTWRTLGQEENGAFEELLGLDGRRVPAQRRARVQARQIYVFAEAGRLGWSGPWRSAMESGLARLERAYLRSDGLVRTLLTPDGTPADERAMIYDQAFVMLALAAAFAHTREDAIRMQATAIRDKLLSDAPPNGGLIETGHHPFQSNAHMHLLEACLAWEELSADLGWASLSDRVIDLAQTCFIDQEGGFIREFFASDWSPADGADGALVEPGHQFEWAWLIARYGRARDRAEMKIVAERLYAFGLQGVDLHRGVVMDALNADRSVRSRRARLWPQTEWLKAAGLLAQLSDAETDRKLLLEDAARAQRALWLYLTPDGAWHDKMLESGDFIDEPAPASSFYHVVGAYAEVERTLSALLPESGVGVALA